MPGRETPDVLLPPPKRFDTHRSENESRRLAEFVGRVEAGLILVMLVNDEASKNLEESGRGGLSKLGSQHVQSVGFRCVHTR